MSDSREQIKLELIDLIKEGFSFYKEKISELNENNLFKNYQNWYTKSLPVVKQLAPERFDEFKELYKVEKRKNIDITNYSISDYLVGYTVTKGPYREEAFNTKNVVVKKLLQQIKIVESLSIRIDYIISDIEGVLRADLFDNEIEASESLLKAKHLRAAGTVAGVVLEAHLSKVCANHEINFKKRNLTISDYNDKLKTEKVLDAPTWRQIQRLGDIRNYCSHKKERDPKTDEVEELIEGVKKIIKTIF